MIELSPEVVAIAMLGGVLVLVLTGYPLAYVVGIIALVVGLFVWQGQVSQMLYLRAQKIMLNYTLLAVPLFVFMGVMLERSGIIERLYDVLYLWLGGFRGGLAIVTVIVGTIMAATVGIITASVTLLTLVLREIVPLVSKGGSGEHQIIAYGILLVVIMIFMPEGLTAGLARMWRDGALPWLSRLGRRLRAMKSRPGSPRQ